MVIFKIKEFYCFRAKLSSSSIHTTQIISRLNYDKDVTEYIVKLLMGDYPEILLPEIFKHTKGKCFDDVVSTGTGILNLVSDRMVKVLEKNNLTGWKTFDIRLLDKKYNEIKGYNGFSVTGRCGAIDYCKSGLIKKRLPDRSQLVEYYKGLHIGLDKWDGTDFFLPRGSYEIIVTSRVARILKESGLTNMKLSNLAEIKRPITY